MASDDGQAHPARGRVTDPANVHEVDDVPFGTSRVSSEWAPRVMELLDAALSRLQPGEQPAARGALRQVTSLLRALIEGEPAKAVPDPNGQLLAWQARRVRDHIDSHIADRLLVSDLAGLIQRSEAHFSRAFRRTFGESPHAFVLRRRLELATRYMLATDAGLADIALRCGFVDQAHLCRRFRAVTGQAPSIWRRERRTDDVRQSLRYP